MTETTGSSRSRRATAATPTWFARPSPSWDDTLIDRMGIARSRDSSRRAAIIIGTLMTITGAAACGTLHTGAGSLVCLVGLLVLTIGGSMASAAELAIQARDERLAELSKTRCDPTSRASIDQLAAQRAALGLLPVEAPYVEVLLEEYTRQAEIARKHAEVIAAQRAFDLQVQATAKLPTLAGHERIVGRDECHYVGSARYGKRGDNDERGTLYLTDDKAIFVGDSRLQFRWSTVDSVHVQGWNGLAIQRRDRQTPHVFVLHTQADALLGEYIARRCLASAGEPRRER